MFGHLESPEDRTKHIALIRDIQKETKGFTEFVPLNFIHTEAPMYKDNLHSNIRNGADGKDVLLMHAISRIMLNNHINNIQTSWVKEGVGMAQLSLCWGANDFGGTLINESISTAAGSGYGQLLKPKDIRQIIRQMGRIPAQRTTSYKIIKTFASEESNDPLDEVQNISQFGSYHELIKLDGYRYKNNRRN
jgi:FO synthase subunit 2